MLIPHATRPSHVHADTPTLTSGTRHWTTLDTAMVASLALQLGGTVVAALLARGWITALALDVLVAATLCLIAAQPNWRPLLTRLLVLGLVAGILELGTDFAGATVAHSLVYPSGEPTLLVSPLYMPLSWMIVLTQIGYLAWRLNGLLPYRWVAVALVSAWGALNIPFYEEMAYSAGWWQYRDTTRLAHTPLYVPLFEACVVALLPVMVWNLERHSWRAVIARGVLLGCWMPCAAFFAWLVLGR